MKIRYITLITIIAFSVCIARTDKEPVACNDCDSLKTAVSGLKEKQNKIEKNIDSLNGKFIYDKYITLESLEKSQKFYDSAFKDIQGSYSNFLTKITIIVAIISIFVAIVSIIASRIYLSAKDEIKKEVGKIKKEVDEIKVAFGNQKNEIGKITEKFENLKEELIGKVEFKTQAEKSIIEEFNALKIQLREQDLNPKDSNRSRTEEKEEKEIPSFTDSRDGRVYPIVEINNQIWMAENLKFRVPIESARNVYNFTNREIYYSWEAAQKICPTGWRLPTIEDWEQLVKNCGSIENTGEKLKHGGFSAFMYGYYIKGIGFNFIGQRAIWWTSTEFNQEKSYVQCIDGKKCYKYEELKENMFSIRCIKI